MAPQNVVNLWLISNEMIIHLRVQHPFGQSLLQFVEQAILAERRLRVASG